VVVARRAATEHGQRFIDILRLGISGDDSPRGIGFLDQVVAILGINGSPARRRFVDASAEGIVFEAVRAMHHQCFRTGERDSISTFPQSVAYALPECRYSLASILDSISIAYKSP
jgi:hypothetical protein